MELENLGYTTVEKHINNEWKLINDSWNLDIITIDNINKELCLSLYKNNENNENNENENENNENNENENNTTFSIITNVELQTILKQLEINNIKNNEDIDILKNIVAMVNWTVVNSEINNIAEEEKEKEEKIKILITVYESICNCLEYFINELGIPKPKLKIATTLNRSSYKLCQQKSNCIYQYPDNIKKAVKCKQQHYPYGNLYIDCKSICNYLNYRFVTNETTKGKFISAFISQNDDINFNELKRCMITIKYVITIIYNELKSVIKYRAQENNFKIRDFHSYKNDKMNGNNMPYRYNNLRK